RETRVTYIEESLDALDGLSRERHEDLMRFVDATARNRCRSTIYRLEISCLLQATASNCRGFPRGLTRVHCQKASDLVVVNKLAEDAFISDEERYAIMKQTADYRPAFRRALEERYATIVTRLVLAGELGADRRSLAESIDTHCHSLSDSDDLSWQHCTAAVIWFVGTTFEKED
ncbi:MAG: hypothetical protein AAF658_20415, partial [Myxococcota bacterium]